MESRHGRQCGAQGVNRFSRLWRLLLVTTLLTSMSSLAASVRSITYSFQLEVSRRPEVCQRMERVFNDKFRNMWDLVESVTDDELAATSPLAFMKLPGVKHDPAFAMQMIGARLPASAEFDAIDWQEGRVTTGAPPGVVVPESDTSRPALVAYVDIDNDGRLDTLLRYGFNEGYRAMRMATVEAEYLRVWRGTRLVIPRNASLWQLESDAPTSLLLVGAYLRPFAIGRRTYLARYRMALGELETRDEGPFPVLSEAMEVLELQHGADAASTTSICRFEMQQR